MTDIGNADVLLRALDSLGDVLGSSTRSRMLSTLRGFCRFLVRRGLLAVDPTDGDELRVHSPTSTDVLAFTNDDVELLVDGAAEPCSARSAWPTRDVAIIDVLASCGLRVSELCGLSMSVLDRRGEQPLLRLTRTKGGKARVVPIPPSTMERVDRYLDERPAVTAGRGMDVVFVRRNGASMNQQFVDALLRRLSRFRGVVAPPGAMAHGLRHFYGSTLAVRGVPARTLMSRSYSRPPCRLWQPSSRWYQKLAVSTS